MLFLLDDLPDPLLLLFHLLVACLYLCLLLLFLLLLLSVRDLHLHLLQLQVGRVLKLTPFALELLLTILDELFLGGFGDDLTFKERVFVVFYEVKLILLQLLLDILLVLHLPVVLPLQFLLDPLVVGLCLRLFELLPLSLDLVLLQLLPLAQSLLHLPLVQHIRQHQLRVKRLHLVLLSVSRL